MIMSGWKTFCSMAAGKGFLTFQVDREWQYICRSVITQHYSSFLCKSRGHNTINKTVNEISPSHRLMPSITQLAGKNARLSKFLHYLIISTNIFYTKHPYFSVGVLSKLIRASLYIYDLPIIFSNSSTIAFLETTFFKQLFLYKLRTHYLAILNLTRLLFSIGVLTAFSF